jgi:tRNA nucleotidyltransferase (CCA-adding enzyme)
LSATLALDPPAAVVRIANRLEDAGFETWAVGGAVRDRVLGRPAGDWDLATLARPDQVQRIFRRTVPIGIDHGTVGVLDGGKLYEVTTFRRDVETFGRHAVVEFADRVEEDLARRDFTINALAWHPRSGRLIDPFGGQDDLRAGRLRTVGAPEDRFAEDYLRVLRALRFAGQLGLEIEAGTWSALQGATEQLGRLSAERVREELLKVLTQIRRASSALDLYRTSGALERLFPELAALAGEPPGEPDHDLWDRTLGAVDAIPPSRPTLRLAALLHAVGMPPSRTRDLRGGWRYTGHEVLGARKAEDVMVRLKASNAERERVVRLVRRQSDLFPPDAPAAGVRRWLRDIGVDLVADLFRLRFALWRAVAREGGRPDDLLERWAMARSVIRARPPLSTADLAIGGAELKAMGLSPGPRFREILAALLERVTDDPSLNEPATLAGIVRREWLHE